MRSSRRPAGRTAPVLLALALCAMALATPVIASFEVPPRPRGPVYDGAGVIRPDDARAIDAIARLLWNKARVSVVVATVPDLGGEPVEAVTVRIAERWGIGSAEEDRGILVLASPGDRRARIEVGYGAEGFINDGLAGEILDRQAIPFFRKGDYSSGLRAAVERIAVLSAREYGFSLDGIRVAPGAQDAGGRRKPGLASKLFGLIAFIALVIIGIRHPWLLLFILMSGRGGGGYRRGGFGGGGGGFGGFGGGGFGGGGASRGW